jgi:hypothetical protein
MSCILLCEFHFADILSPKGDDKQPGTAILFRTSTGTAFLDSVTSPLQSGSDADAEKSDV